jgi:hypothetical protein
MSKVEIARGTAKETGAVSYALKKEAGSPLQSADSLLQVELDDR